MFWFIMVLMVSIHVGLAYAALPVMGIGPYLGCWGIAILITAMAYLTPAKKGEADEEE